METTENDRKNPLVIHALRELELTRESPEFAEAIVKMVQIFADMGLSGMSAEYTIQALERLLRFKNLTQLTSDPDEWIEVGYGVWQNRRNSEAFSSDGGRTYSLLSERKRRRWPLKGYSRPMHKSGDFVSGGHR